MKESLSKFLFLVTTVVFLAALQDVTPDFGGVKPPLLLSATLWFSFTRARTGASIGILAVCAGAFCDALGALPFTCNTTFFLLAALAVFALNDLVRSVSLPLAGCAVMLLAAPAGELWLASWHSENELAIRFFSSGVCAIVCGVALIPILEFLAEHAGYPKYVYDEMRRRPR